MLKYLIIALLSLFIFLSTSCQPYQLKTEIEQTESLLSQIDRATETLIINVDAIKARRDTMKERMRVIQADFADSVTQEMQFLLTDYRGVIRSYDHFVRKYSVLEFENEHHKQRIENLRKDLLSKAITVIEFREIYEKEKDIIGKHAEEVREIVGSVVTIEQMYNRCNTKVTGIYKSILNSAVEQ
jgi:hypothetical protein